ncbi:hypothetical protein GF325_16105 [Candidatus Bathyarchaeota archaeon]|nr:hypothetical protein [Candidatus Bathyarchaeota archaeon]
MASNDPDEDDYLPETAKDELKRVRNAHDVYLRAVNNPVRKRVLELLCKGCLTRVELISALMEENLVSDEGVLFYHLQILEKANCITRMPSHATHHESEGEDAGSECFKLTLEGKVVEYLD